jgi:hypothetical protein
MLKKVIESPKTTGKESLLIGGEIMSDEVEAIKISKNLADFNSQTDARTHARTHFDKSERQTLRWR